MHTMEAGTYYHLKLENGEISGPIFLPFDLKVQYVDFPDSEWECTVYRDMDGRDLLVYTESLPRRQCWAWWENEGRYELPIFNR